MASDIKGTTIPATPLVQPQYLSASLPQVKPPTIVGIKPEDLSMAVAKSKQAWHCVLRLTDTGWNDAVSAGFVELWTPKAGEVIDKIIAFPEEGFNDESGSDAVVGPFRFQDSEISFQPTKLYIVGRSGIPAKISLSYAAPLWEQDDMVVPSTNEIPSGFPVIVTGAAKPIIAAVSGTGYSGLGGANGGLQFWAMTQGA